MKRFFLITAVVCGMVLVATLSASAAGNRGQRSIITHRATTTTVVSSDTTVPNVGYNNAPVWNGHYYDPAWGMPVALVVPPRAQTEIGYAWGVGNTFMRPITAQFRPYYPGPYHYDGRAYRPTPCWPSHTDQFGVYSVRGPW